MHASGAWRQLAARVPTYVDGDVGAQSDGEEYELLEREPFEAPAAEIRDARVVRAKQLSSHFLRPAFQMLYDSLRDRLFQRGNRVGSGRRTHDG